MPIVISGIILASGCEKHHDDEMMMVMMKDHLVSKS